MKLPNPLGHKALWPSGLGNYIICKRFAVQTLLWSLEFAVIYCYQIKHKSKEKHLLPYHNNSNNLKEININIIIQK